jgi:hypothetical protein
MQPARPNRLYDERAGRSGRPALDQVRQGHLQTASL